MSEFKDCFGQEIKVGSKVAFVHPQYGQGCHITVGATVTRLTKTMVEIDTGRRWRGVEKPDLHLKYPSKIVVAPNQ